MVALLLRRVYDKEDETMILKIKNKMCVYEEEVKTKAEEAEKKEEEKETKEEEEDD